MQFFFLERENGQQQIIKTKKIQINYDWPAISKQATNAHKDALQVKRLENTKTVCCVMRCSSYF